MGMLNESYGYSGEVSYWLLQGILWNDNLKRIMENRLRSAVELTANVWYTAMIRSGLTIQAPALIDPENGENTIRMPTLTWAPVEGINAYDFQLSTDNNFTSNVITIKDLTANSYIPKDPLAYGTWYWRVRSGDNSTHIGLWSQACNFTVAIGYTTPPYEWTPRVSITDVANGDDVGAWVTLPFEFPFWGEPKTRVWICSNGFLIFDPSEAINWTSGDLNALKQRWMIAPFWCDLRTDVAGGIVSDPGVYVDSYDDKVVITWEVTRYGYSSDSIKFQVILYSNGDIRINLDNATNFWNFSPTLGVSRGDGISYFDITGERETNKSWLFRLIGVGPTPRTPIYIYGNAGFTPANGVVAGSGTESDPYIIENWRISAKNNYGIQIYNTTAYFTIRNCYVYDGWTNYWDGINLYNVRNGKISNNSVENNSRGISLSYSSNNIIDNNFVRNNRWCGIYLYSSSNNIITNSTTSRDGDMGIYLYSSSNNTVENNILKNNRYEGISLGSSSNNIVKNNIMMNNGVGILCMFSSNNNSISNNLMVNNHWQGIQFYYSSNNIVDNNIMMSNNVGIQFYYSSNNIVDNNIMRSNGFGIDLYYSTNNSISNNLMVNNDADGICLEYSDSNSISNNLMENNYRGTDFWSSSNNNLILNNTCSNNEYYGIFLQNSSNNNTISNNTCESNPIGIYLGYSDNTLISNNTVRNNSLYGIEIDSSGNNTLDNNTFSNNSDGIYLYYAKENNLISNNTIESNVRGIEIVRSPNNLISNNQAVGNSTGIWIRNSNYNRTFHNNFVNNSTQARDESSNYWDNGYPSGGNYWSDYTGIDNFWGMNQDIPGSDGIGDTPYDIYGGANQDHYPLMSPVVAKPRLYLVYVGGRGDLSFNDMAYMGGMRAEGDLGVELVEMYCTTEADYVQNLRAAASDPNAKLIVGVSFLMTNALVDVAKEFPDKNFVGIDTYCKSVEPQPNLLDVVFEEHKGSALVGALAAMLAYHHEKPYIGAVLGMEIPVLWKFEIGYKWGAEYWAPAWYRQRFGEWPPMVDTLWTYTGTFSDITKGYEAAVPMYARDAVAVYNIAGPLGLGINQAVEEIAEAENLEHGPPFWIGVDADQDWINPGFVIASMMKRVDKGVYYATQLVMENKFREAVEEYGNQITLGIGTTVLGMPMEGISVSTLDDLDAFMEMGIEAGIIGPENRLAIYEKVRSMRENQPAWVWEAVAELEDKIRTGEVEVLMVMTDDALRYWRSVFERLPAPAHIEFMSIGTTTVDAKDETDTTVMITTGQAGPIAIIRSEDNPGGPAPSGFAALGKYIEVLTDIPSGNIVWPIEIRIYYTDEEVAAARIYENSLRIFYWDGSNWVEEPDFGVNLENNYIWARVTHLSVFAPMGSPAPAPAPVGGIAFPADKLALLAPWIILSAIITIAAVSVAVYWRRRQ